MIHIIFFNCQWLIKKRKRRSEKSGRRSRRVTKLKISSRVIQRSQNMTFLKRRIHGWGRGIRTPESRDQNPLPYRLAIPQCNFPQ